MPEGESMNIIKNYLESMFANMPNTPEVLRAKDELLQMMEDKYNELINDGKSENEAVGTVISEFGNLEELSSELGLEKEQKVNTGRVLKEEEYKGYIKSCGRYGVATGIGVFLCINCVIGPMIMEALRLNEMIGVSIMMGMIALAVGIFVMSSATHSKWKYIKREALQLDYQSTQDIKAEKERYAGVRALFLSVGVILCVICWLPVAIVSEVVPEKIGAVNIEVLVATSLFMLVGLGVFLIVSSAIKSNAYKTLLNLNGTETVSGTYSDNPQYTSTFVANMMQVYWSTVTCLYLIWSFLTFEWGKTWIIWVIAAIVEKIIRINCTRKE